MEEIREVNVNCETRCRCEGSALSGDRSNLINQV